jgi:hypothetical protein
MIWRVSDVSDSHQANLGRAFGKEDDVMTINADR